MTTTAIAAPADEPQPAIVPGQRALIENVAFTHLPRLAAGKNAWRRFVARFRMPRCNAIGCGCRWPCPTYRTHRRLDEQLLTVDQSEGKS